MSEKISKFLSFILRHKPEDIDLLLDDEGWALITDIVKNAPSKLNITKTAIEQVVTTCEKQRYKISDDGRKIRANQGHSIKVNLNLTASTPPVILYHGTATRFLDSIFNDGLKPGNRQYIHLSDNIDTASAVGKRHGNLIMLTIDTVSMINDGYVFYLSDNNVWLTDIVPVKYITVA